MGVEKVQFFPSLKGEGREGVGRWKKRRVEEC